MVLAPVVLKTTELQLPLPDASVKVQLVSAPEMVTVPVGVGPSPLTVALTVIACPVETGLGVLAVMTVAVGPLFTVWPTLVELPA
jgi:hypothetical protein